MNKDFKLDKVVDKILSIIIQKSHPEKVILFGSRVNENVNEDSDYDFIIIKNGIKNEREITCSIYHAFYEEKIPVPVDLIAVDSKKWEKHKNNHNMIYSKADKEGIVLYG